MCKKLTGKVTSYPDKNTSGNTPLKAAKKGYLNIVKFLVENNADINHTNQNGKTVLILIADNNIEGVKFLIENGAKIECIDNFWESRSERIFAIMNFKLK
ncbi:ankyrin repeat domain-containing protein [Spiroplasma endosymbiont of Phycita roborella]|uniref:ankyrin repeat domain-containing protein n=1 Tax=Spiroplasma endosymbiont of Phycita roborella TaxID=3066311 RepID=UPI00313CE0C5